MLVNMTIIYFILFALGFGYARLLAAGALQIAIAPVIGYCILSVLSVYFMAFDLNRHYFFYSIAILSIPPYFLALKYYVGQKYEWQVFPYISMIVFLIVCVILSNNSGQRIYFSINPDLIGYILSAEWLSNSQNTILSLSGNLPVQYEMLHVAMRWGFPNVVSSLSLAMHQAPFKMVFPVSAVLLFSGAWSSAILFNRRYSVFTPFFLQAVIIFISVNVGVLYLIYEGFYPNVIGFSLLSILMLLLTDKNFGKKEVALGAILAGSTIATYSEVYTLYVLVVLGFVFVQSVQEKRVFFKHNAYLILTLISGFALVFPLGIKIVYFTFANLHNANNVGYPQPKWIFPSDIIGLTNIYSHYKYYIEGGAPHVIRRGPFSVFIGALLSLWVGCELFKQRKEPLLIVAVLGSLAFFSYNEFLAHHLYPPVNYFYDKLVMLFSAVFICYFLKSLFENQKNYKDFVLVSLMYLLGFFKSFFGDRKNYKIFAVILFFVSSVLFFIPGNLKYKGSVNVPEMKSLVNQFKDKDVVFFTNERGYFHGKMVTQLRMVDRVQDMFLDMYSHGRLLDQWNSLSCRNFKAQSPILLVLKKADFNNASALKKRYRGMVVYESSDYLVVNTQKKVADICVAGVIKPDTIFVREKAGL